MILDNRTRFLNITLEIQMLMSVHKIDSKQNPICLLISKSGGNYRSISFSLLILYHYL